MTEIESKITGYIVVSPSGNQTIIKGGRDTLKAVFGMTKTQLVKKGWSVSELRN